MNINTGLKELILKKNVNFCSHLSVTTDIYKKKIMYKMISAVSFQVFENQLFPFLQFDFYNTLYMNIFFCEVLKIYFSHPTCLLYRLESLYGRGSCLDSTESNK